MMPTSFSAMTSNSPKWKRESSDDSDRFSPFPVSPSTSSLPSLPELKLREEEDLGRFSPRAIVAGRLGELAIRGDHLPTPPQTCDLNGSSSPIDQPPVAQSAQARCWSPSYARFSAMPETDASLEQPSPTPCGGPSDNAAIEPSAQPQSHSIITPTSSPRKKATPSPRKKLTLLSPSKSRSGRQSPPLAGRESDDPLTWHDSEITGHDPKDPSDDGYGINGIGFKPTAAMAWARSQKRQKQVAEWKNREAREAREKRRERRDNMDMGRIHTVQKGAIQKRVKFDV